MSFNQKICSSKSIIVSNYNVLEFQREDHQKNLKSKKQTVLMHRKTLEQNQSSKNENLN